MTLFFVIKTTIVNAGETVINGTSIDSSSFSGNSFTPENNNTIPTPAPNTNVFVETSGIIIISPPVQQQLNNTGKLIFDNNRYRFDDNSNSVSSIYEIIFATSKVNFFRNQFNSSLQDLGVPKGLVNKFVKSLVGLIQESNSNLINKKMRKSSKDLLDNTFLTKRQSTIFVDINQLHAAIKAYNQIIIKSNPATLNKLVKNPDFLKISQILKKLRASINQKN